MTKTDADGVGVGAVTLTPSVADGLIAVSAADIGGTLRPAVAARALHRFLGVKQDFLVWVENRMAEYGFIEGPDFLLPKWGSRKMLASRRQQITCRWILWPTCWRWCGRTSKTVRQYRSGRTVWFR